MCEEPGDLFAICVAKTTPDPFADFLSELVNL